MRQIIVEFTNESVPEIHLRLLYGTFYKNGFRETITWKGVEYDLQRFTAYCIETEKSFEELELQIRKIASRIHGLSSMLRMRFIVPTQNHIDLLDETILLQDCTACGCL